GKSFGASTSTQQLVKNLTGDDRVSIDRKITEMFSALDLERRASKREILEMYLNVINLADGCRGVGAAAKHYFSKSVDQLTIGECACIAAITNNPVRYNPLTHPEQNEQRRVLILACMLEQGYIDAERYVQAVQPLSFSKQSREKDRVASWYEDMIIEDITRDLCEKYGYTRAAASALVYGGGLRIYAAMDERVQDIVEQYFATTDIFERDERASMVIIDPQTGDILGVAGANGTKRANRVQNYATDVRLPPGSAIKPLSVFAPALEQGLINWATVFDDVPLRFEDGKPWPRNAHFAYHGLTDASVALADSVNTVAVQILEQVGRKNSLSFLREQLGMISLSDDDTTQAGLALGQFAHGVTLRELTNAYTVLYDGNYHPARSYFRVTDAAGNVAYFATTGMVGDTLAPVLNGAEELMQTHIVGPLWSGNFLSRKLQKKYIKRHCKTKESKMEKMLKYRDECRDGILVTGGKVLDYFEEIELSPLCTSKEIPYIPSFARLMSGEENEKVKGFVERFL
ncbi:MAG: transglycosylase domain-containing protein, partial [Clostridia bacterium]|nr:transglycosylase domain-containing protein [Clostridia bacterium]